jgi:hypothetical protein
VRRSIGNFIFYSTAFATHSFHRRYNQLVSVRHPSLWLFLARLKSEERRIARTVKGIKREQYRDNRRRKWRKLEDRISTLKNRYVIGVITLQQ